MSTATKERPRSALFDALDSGELVQSVPLTMLEPAKDNPRSDVGDIDETARSMQTIGVLQPLVVTKNGSARFTIVCGHRRYAAAKKAGLDEVPVVVRDLTDQQRREAMLIENLQREDLSVLDEARAYRDLLEVTGIAQRELARRIGREQGHISKRLALLELPEKVQAKVGDSAGITVSDALELTKLAGEPKRIDAVLRAAKNSWASIPDEVAGELREMKAEAKAGETMERLTAAGIPIVEYPRHGWFASKHKRIGKGTYDGLEHVTVKAHAKEPCHAAAINPSSGERVYVCINPKAHLGKAKGATRSKQSAKALALQAHEKELKAAAKERKGFIAEVVRRRPSRTEAIEELVRALIEPGGRAQVDICKAASEFLELDPVVHDGDRYMRSSKDWRETLWAYAQANPDNAARVALALALAIGEEHHLRYGISGDSPSVVAHFDVLKRHGYDRSSAERKELVGKAPR